MICYLTRLSDGCFVFLSEEGCLGGTQPQVSAYMAALGISTLDRARLFQSVESESLEPAVWGILQGCV